MNPTTAVDLRKAYRTTVIVGLAMLASLVVYAVVAETIKKQNEPFGGFNPLPDVIDTLRYALLAVAGVEFIVIQVLNKIILSANIPAQNRTANPFGQLVTASIVSFALCESVAVYGLVLFLIQGNTKDFYLFVAISALYFAVYFPRYGKWEAWAEGREQGRGMKEEGI